LKEDIIQKPRRLGKDITSKKMNILSSLGKNYNNYECEHAQQKAIDLNEISFFSIYSS
jgi:hypothetical protein